jgi:hypothetical protein
MQISVNLLDESNEPWFFAERELPADYMLKLAAARDTMVKEKGPEFAQGAIPAFGRQLVEVVKSGAKDDEIEKAVVELGLAVVVLDRMLGIDDAVLKQSQFVLSVYQDGMVRYDRL